MRDARRLQAAGVFALVLEAVPAALARRITRALRIPTIGIGAGPHTDGQILVVDDLLGLSEGPAPRFVKPYAALGQEARRALLRFQEDVRAGRFPGPEQSYA
jgi:3-methyl-2-oxobutanoate hydroxymethyltransferase